MTVYKAANTSGWSDKAIKNMTNVVKGAAQDTAELMTRRQPGVADTGGSFEVGRVPVDTGELISSVIVEVAGVRRGQGQGENPPDFAASIAGHVAGQDIVVAFTAPHSRPLEYGTGRFAGRFFVRNAVQQWSRVVDANAALYKD